MKDQNKIESLDELLLKCDDFIKNNSGPWVFLACHDCDEVFAKKVTKIFSLDKKNKDGCIFLFSKDKNLNHKEKSLRLFFAGVFITSKLKNASACLGQLNVLGERLKKHDQDLKDIIFSEATSEDFINWKPSNGHLSIGTAAKIYLEQAGIHIVKQSILGSEYAQILLSHTQDSEKHSKRTA